MEARDKPEETAPGTLSLQEKGCYLYCVASVGERLSLGRIGLEGEEVYTIPYEDLAAVVHRCPPQPYASAEQEVVVTWVTAHQRVVEAAWRRWDPILPLGFDNIIVSAPQQEVEVRVRGWLEREYERLKEKMERVKGKGEFGVQVFWDTRAMAQSLSQGSPQLRQLAEEVKAAPRGQAYWLRQRLETRLKEQMEVKARQCCQDLYDCIHRHAADICRETVKKGEGDRKMLLGLSCLLPQGKVRELGEELEALSRREGLSVRFTGPWPPYSFVGYV